MPDPCEYVYEVVAFQAVHLHGLSALMEEAVAINDSDTTSAWTLMAEAVALTQATPNTKVVAKPRVYETVHWVSSSSLKIGVPVMAETITFTSVFTGYHVVHMFEAVTLTSVFGPKTYAYKVVSETVTCTDTWRGGSSYLMSETVAATNVFAHSNYIARMISETITATGSMTLYADAWAQSVSEGITCTVAIGHRSTMKAAVSETMTLAEAFWFRNPGSIAWKMNTETTAASWNTNYEFDSVAQYGNTIVATAPDGVYVLSGDDDQGTNIDSTVKTGFMDMGDKHNKRLDGVYFGLKGSALKLSLEVFGGTQSYEYTMFPKTVISPAGGRIVPGKGLISRYWRLTFNNVDGGDFDIDDIEIDVAASKQRRI